MDEKLLAQLKLLQQYLDTLYKVRKHTREEYLKDEILQGAAERYLQLAIETCINIGNRILSLEQFTQNFKAPETYSEIFAKLAELNIINTAEKEQFQKMAKFRNRLVHIYWELDAEFVYSLLHTNLGDFEMFLKLIAAYLEKQ